VSVLLDAQALIALLADEPAADQVETLLRRGEAAITAVNLAEALDVLQRVGGIPRDRLEALTMPLVGDRMKLVAIDEQIARDAADIRARHYHRIDAPVSLADCMLLAAAGESDALATGDEALIRVAKSEHVRVKALPS
jgi:PIN domain nuclease of toxin-antitoxin system